MNDECVLHKCDLALLLIDVINDLEFQDGEKLAATAVPVAGNIARLKLEAKSNGVPCLYVNDNFGQWQSDFKHLMSSCMRDGIRGAPLVKQFYRNVTIILFSSPDTRGFFKHRWTFCFESWGRDGSFFVDSPLIHAFCSPQMTHICAALIFLFQRTAVLRCP